MSTIQYAWFKIQNFEILNFQHTKIVSEYDQEIPQSQTADNPMALRGRATQPTITRHQEDKLSKATSSQVPIKMIAILEWTLSNVQQNIEQLQTPTMGVTVNNKSTTSNPKTCSMPTNY